MKKLLFMILCSITACLHAQSDTEILKEARKQAGQKNYGESLRLINLGLDLYPGHYDLLSYKIRLLLWDRQFDEAQPLLDRLLEMYPRNEEALEIQLMSLLWQEDWPELLKHAEGALSMQKENDTFRFYKAKALIGLSEFASAKAILDAIGYPEAKILRDQLFLKEHRFTGLSASYSRFSEVFTPWTLVSATYGQTGKHSWDVSSTYGNMFDLSGIRFNANAYPTLTPKLTAFLEAGYSPSDFFPGIELGAELIRAIRAFEVGVGARYMNFGDDQDVIIYKGGLGCYFGQNYAGYRIYHTRVLDNPSSTHLVTMRHFFNTRYHYLQLQGSLGSTPIQINSLREVQRLDAAMISLSYRHLLKNNKWMFEAGVGYQNERYLERQSRERFNVQVGLFRFWD